VTAILRVMGLQNERQFQNYHRVLNRAIWSSRALSRLLLRMLIQLFVPADAPIVVGIDETIERRRGAKIAAKGIYRDPVRSSKEFFVKTSGLRWIIRWRRLCRDHEGLPSCSEALIKIASCSRMLSKLAPAYASY
jgi:DDE superfamily endonuclease